MQKRTEGHEKWPSWRGKHDPFLHIQPTPQRP